MLIRTSRSCDHRQMKKKLHLKFEIVRVLTAVNLRRIGAGLAIQSVDEGLCPPAASAGLGQTCRCGTGND